MTNTVNITEVTSAQAADSTNAVNLRGKQEYLKPRVIRITDHDNNDVAEVADDTDKMALFHQEALGHPWIQGLKDMQAKHIIHQAALPPALPPTDFTVLYPDWDYADFE